MKPSTRWMRLGLFFMVLGCVFLNLGVATSTPTVWLEVWAYCWMVFSCGWCVLVVTSGWVKFPWRSQWYRRK